MEVKEFFQNQELGSLGRKEFVRNRSLLVVNKYEESITDELRELKTTVLKEL